MDFWKIIVGLVTAAFLVHFGGAYARAQRQQLVATRLNSYLWYWKGWVLDNKLFPVFNIAMEWNKQEHEVFSKGGGGEGLVKLQEEKKKMIDEIKAKIEADDSPADLQSLKASVQKLPSNTVDALLEQCRRNEQNLLDGKTFVSDEDASVLGPYYAMTCVRLKMNLISIFEKGVGEMIKVVSDPDNFSLQEAAGRISDIVWRGVLLSKDIDSLTVRVGALKDRSILALTMNNLRYR